MKQDDLRYELQKSLVVFLGPTNLFEMKKILVATDYSSTATNAVHYAAHLAQVFQSELILFNVYNLDVHSRNARITPDAINAMHHNNESRLMTVATEVIAQYHIAVNCVTKSHDAVEDLEEYLPSHPVDVVVLGMDSNLIENKLFGNTTTAALRHLKCPLLVVPNDVQFNGIKKILYAYEATFLQKDNHLTLLKEFARKFDAALQIFHVETKVKPLEPSADADAANALTLLMEDVNYSYACVLNRNVPEGIIQEVKEWQADLLVMVPHSVGFWESLINGSTTRKMMLICRVPLLALPNAHW